MEYRIYESENRDRFMLCESEDEQFVLSLPKDCAGASELIKSVISACVDDDDEGVSFVKSKVSGEGLSAEEVKDGTLIAKGRGEDESFSEKVSFGYGLVTGVRHADGKNGFFSRVDIEDWLENASAAEESGLIEGKVYSLGEDRGKFDLYKYLGIDDYGAVFNHYTYFDGYTDFVEGSVRLHYTLFRELEDWSEFWSEN